MKKIVKDVKVELVGKSVLSTCVPIISKNRMLDGVDWMYIENFENELPTENSKIYHEWSMKDGKKLTGYMIPMSDVK